jgi:hypothetical protein
MLQPLHSHKKSKLYCWGKDRVGLRAGLDMVKREKFLPQLKIELQP